ncbi:DUF2179 domain-containing protein [Alkalibaculum sp. M08DMB]|uniref:UPF0316 protein GC105_01340 n=1 Tax=Alkalibaculum sporogenes TaxID=2655001 RepID=A0A6A7K4Q0_9FIRM|nr:DUF2179 domain-containing protein [Alkalibaculum sporogenes]
MNEIFLIILVQLIYVPIFTLRTMFLVKHMTLLASLLGFMEALIYVFALSLVLSENTGVIAMLVYAVGFGVGILIGGAIENKLAIGYNNLVVNLMEKNEQLINHLRNEGYGVTVYEGEGRDSKRYRLDILTKRCREEELMHIIEEFEPRAFIICYEAKRFKGGYLLTSMKKMRKNRGNECK